MSDIPRSVPTSDVPVDKLREIIPNLPEMTTYLCFVLDWTNNAPVRVNIEFLLNKEQVRKFLELMSDGSWRESKL